MDISTRVSEAEIDAAAPARGRWTRKQLAEWGVPWPPPKGWRKDLAAGRPVRQKTQPETTRKPRKPRAPRNPNTRCTPLRPGQEWTVELGTLNGRVRRADYGRYMKSPAWSAKRRWWWERAGRPGTCSACAAPWSLNRGDLHHRTYDRLGYELLGDLVQLCGECHRRVHAAVKQWSELQSQTDRTIQLIRIENGLASA